MLLWRPIWPKRTQKCVYGDEIFCLQYYWNTRHPFNSVLNINLDTFDVQMQHLCITAPKYGGLYWTFYDIRNTQFLSILFVIRVQKWKKWPTGSGVNFRLYQNMSNFMINYESVSARLRFWTQSPTPLFYTHTTQTLAFLW